MGIMGASPTLAVRPQAYYKYTAYLLVMTLPPVSRRSRAQKSWRGACALKVMSERMRQSFACRVGCRGGFKAIDTGGGAILEAVSRARTGRSN